MTVDDLDAATMNPVGHDRAEPRADDGEAAPDSDVGAGSTRLWPGDRGTLRAPSRRALVQLLRGPYLSADRHGLIWGALLNDEEAIRSRLADLFLELVIDSDQQVAFVRNVDHEDVDAPRVVRTAPLTFIDTALLLHLRQQLLTAAPGERVIVGQDEVADQLSAYRAVENTDERGFARRINASWEKLKKYGILAGTTTEGRFEVAPVLRLIFGPDEIAAVRVEYARLAAQAGAALPGLDRDAVSDAADDDAADDDAAAGGADDDADARDLR